MEPRPSFSGATLEHALAIARLPLPDERAAMAGAALDAMYGLVDLLDEIDVGETPPATAFDARWD